MVKEKRILSYFIGWLVLGLIVCFVGITKTYAATTTTYENIGYLNDVTILYSLSDDPPYPIEIPRNGEYQLYNVEKIIVQIDNYTFSGGTTYNLELSLPITTLNNNIYSVIDENGNKCSIGTTDSSNSSYPNYSFNCTKSTNSLTLNIYNTDGSDILNAGIFRWNYIYLRKQLTTTDTSILENQQSQMIEQNQQIIQGQDEIKDTIKDQFESCHMSYNLLGYFLSSQIKNGLEITNNGDGSLTLNGTTTDVISMVFSSVMNNLSVGNYYFSINATGSVSDKFNKILYGSQGSSSVTLMNLDSITLNGTPLGVDTDYKLYYLWFYIKKGITFENYTIKPMLNEGTSPIPWEPYGEEICTNKLDEQNETIKGGFSSIGNWFKELGDKIGTFFDNLLQGILDGLKSLFIPEDGYFENWFNSLKAFFEVKLGFLATPFTIIIDFINRYLNLNPSADIIINIPDITVPNFEEHVIVKATTFNWSQLLKSKESLNTLWQLYLSFVDVFLILNFINLCENKYNRIFGGDTSQYEYYTVEESYTINDNTGEATNHRLNERRTTRKKVV